MKKLILMLVLLAFSPPGSAYALSMVASNGQGTTIRLFLDACTPPVADLIHDEYVKDFHAANVTNNGKEYKACWSAEPEDDKVYVIMENGQMGTVSKEAFKPDEGV